MINAKIKYRFSQLVDCILVVLQSSHSWLKFTPQTLGRRCDPQDTADPRGKGMVNLA
jgi:hypothetical protein